MVEGQEQTKGGLERHRLACPAVAVPACQSCAALHNRRPKRARYNRQGRQKPGFTSPSAATSSSKDAAASRTAPFAKFGSTVTSTVQRKKRPEARPFRAPCQGIISQYINPSSVENQRFFTHHVQQVRRFVLKIRRVRTEILLGRILGFPDSTWIWTRRCVILIRERCGPPCTPLLGLKGVGFQDLRSPNELQ